MSLGFYGGTGGWGPDGIANKLRAWAGVWGVVLYTVYVYYLTDCTVCEGIHVD